jgi:imidazolonepropionase-like amidohydrolase
VGLTPQFYEVAAQQGERETMAWIAERMEALGRTLRLAAERGVRVLAGTDWFPNPTVADEIQELHQRGLPLESALAAGTYGAREWLGMQGLEHGARADLVLFREDPRQDLTALSRPELIIIGGRQVSPSLRGDAQARKTWSDVRSQARAAI